MSVKIQVKRALSSSWSSVNPILSVGEFGLETDTNKLKLGTGAAWNSTEYLSETIDISGLSDVVITDVQNGDFLRYSNSASAWVNDPVNLSTDTVGDYVQNLTAGTGVTLSNNSGEGATPTVAIGQDVATSASVQFAKVTAPVTGNLTGNADTATSLQTARTISLGGDLSGSASFNGTSNITISASVVNSGVSLNEISDVVITSPEEFQSLVYDGTNFVNQYAPVVTYVRNAEATTLTTGTVVYLFGGNGDHATVKRADNDSDVTSSKTVGLVAASIASSENGPVVTRGYVDGIDLSVGYNAGDVLWLGEDGAFTKTKPSAPEHLVYIGVVVRATENGIVYVATQNGYELDELHDVKINGVTDGQFLRYNSASTVWVNDTINLGTDTAGSYVESLVAGTGVSLLNNSGEGATPTIAIGQDVGTSASVLFTRVETTGDAVIGGNLTVNGTTTTLNTEHMTVEDQFITLNSGAAGSPTLSAGIEVERGDSANVFLHWNESTDKWETTNDGSTYSVIATNGNIALGTDTTGNYMSGVTASTGVTVSHTPGEGSTATISIGQPVDTSASVTFANVTADLVGNVTGNVTGSSGSTTGNAATATALQNARTISISGDVSGSVSFNGSQDVVISATIQPNSVALGTDTSGDYVSSLVAGTGVSLNNNSGEGATPGIAIGQDVATSASVTFAAVTAPLAGNASTASALQTSRTISLSGDVSGSVSFDGSANAEITATIQPNSVALGTDTTGNYMSDLTQGTGVTITHTPGEGSNATIAIGQAVGTSSSVQFAAVTAPIIGNVTGNADTATALDTARTISLGGDLSGSVSFDGTSDVSITATVQPNSIALGTDTTGNYLSGVTASTGVIISHTEGEGSTATFAIGQPVGITDGPTFQYLSISDGSSGLIFNYDQFTGNSTRISQNVTPTGVNFIQLPDASGTVALSGSIALGTDTTGNYVSGVTAGTGVTVTHTPGEGSSPTIAIGQAVGTSASVTFANVTADLVGNVTGNASTVTNGVYTSSSINALADVDTVSASPTSGQFLKWNGTNWVPDSVPTINALDDIGNVTVPSPSSGDFLKWNGTAWVNDAVDLGTDTTGNYVSDITAGTGVTVTHTPGEGSSPTVAIGQAVGTSSSVQFAAVTAPLIGNVTGNLTGNADTATALATSRTIELTGDVTGSVSFNGSANASISATIAPNSVALGTDTTGNYVSSLVAGTGLTISNNSGETATPTIAIGQDVATTASVTFAQVETTGSLIVGQNLYVSGSVVTENSVSLALEDPFIYLNSANTITNPDLGIAGNYNDGTYHHAGVFRDATDGKWKFFDSYTPEPSHPIDTSHASYSAAPVVAEYFESIVANGTAPLTVSSSTVVTNFNADLLDGQHGSYYAPLASPTFSGTVTLPTGTVTSGMIADGAIVNADINASAAIALSKLASGTSGQIIVANSSGVPTWVSETGDVTISDTGVTAISSGVIVNADINTSAAIALSKLATGTAGAVVLHNSSGVPTATAISGDISITDAGVTAISSGVIVNADINASAAIALSKLASGTSAQVIIANASGVPTYTTLSGDVTISNTGVASIAANSVALGTDTTGDYVSSLVAGTGVTLTNNSGESATPTVAIGQAVGTASNVQFANVTATGLLTVGTSSGTEGGEIQLLPAVTGNTLSGNVTIDIYQNKLRIFEASGTNRGVYIDLTSASAAVGSNLLSPAGATTLDGLSDVTAPTPSSGDFLKYNGSAWINASGVVTTADTGTVTSAMLAGSIVDTKLSTISTAGKVSNSATTATSANTASAIVARDASGNFTAGTITATAIATATTFIGTTSVALNRSSANLALTGISSVALPGSTSGTVTLQPAATAGTTTITLPATTGTVVTSGDTGTVTSAMIADSTIVNGDISASAAIALSKLASGTSGQIIVANASGVPTWVSESGDISISDTGVTAIKSSVALSGVPTAATASAGTNTTQIATTAFTTTAVRDSLVRLYMEVM